MKWIEAKQSQPSHYYHYSQSSNTSNPLLNISWDMFTEIDYENDYAWTTFAASNETEGDLEIMPFTPDQKQDVMIGFGIFVFVMVVVIGIGALIYASMNTSREGRELREQTKQECIALNDDLDRMTCLVGVND